MSNLNNLTSKILEDAKAKSEEIIKAAEQEAAVIVDKKLSEAREIEKDYFEKANREAVTKKERMLSGVELKVRNEKLAAKQFVVEKVFSTAIDKLNNLSADELMNFIKDTIGSMDIYGDEKLIVPAQYRDKIDAAFLNDLNLSLKLKGKNGNITLSNMEGSFKGGFILEKNGIEINSIFEALVQSMRDELEYEVAKVLFS
jgi:V/A-type H+/Na+-transporting ATPase subunit E